MLILTALLLAAGCNGEKGGGNEEDATEDQEAVEEAMEDQDALEDAGEKEIEGPPQIALTANSSYNYLSGSYSVIRLDDLTVEADIAAINPDAVARCLDGTPVILERYGADTVTVIDAESPYAILRQFSVEGGSNPVDIASLSSGKVVVARNNAATAAILDLGDGTLDVDSIDLAGFADADGLPEMGAVLVAEGKILVALQLLDRETPLWDPTGPGVVALFDASSLDPVDTDPGTPEVDGIMLGGANPLPPFQTWPVEDGVYLVAEVGFYGQKDGRIEGIDVTACEVTGTVVTEETLGGDIAAFVVVDGETGYALVSMPGLAGDKLVSFNPTDGSLVRDAIVERDSYTMTGMALTGDGRLLVIDRTLDRSGVLVLDAVTGNLLTETPISTGVSPFSICVQY